MNKVAFLFLSVLAFTVLLGITQTLPPPAVSATVPAGEFSAERAMRHIEFIAVEPHPVGSAANERVRAYILTELKNAGLETETQKDGQLENVVGRLAGTKSSDAALLTAHLDSVPQSPGATDDGSGVAVLLETVRALTASSPLRNTVLFLFTDDEEGGLNGAKAFIAHHPWAKDVRVVIGFDAGGLSGPGVLSTTSVNNGWLIRQLAEADRYLIGSSAINALADSGTDFGHAFKPAGFSGYAFDLYWDRRLHSPDDNIRNVNLSSLQHQGYHALALARHFGNLESLMDLREPDAVYFSILRLFTVHYASPWSIPLATGVSGGFFAVLTFGLRRKILTWRGVAYGIFIVLIGIVLAPLPAIVLGHWGVGVPFRSYGRLLDRPSEVMTVTLLSIGLIVSWYFLALRIKRVNLSDVALGALVPMWVGMIAASIILPTLSFALTWPLLFSLLAGAHYFFGYPAQKNTHAGIASLLVSAVCDVLLLEPTIMLGLFDQMPLTLLLVGVLCGFLAPQIYLMLGYPLKRSVAA